MPFRVVTEVVSALTAGVLSKSSVHRMVQGVGQDALDEDRERWEAQFERGEEMSEGRQRSDILYTEADGVWIHLQREARKHYEVKSGIAYRGWRRVAEERYELVGKRVYVHGDDTIPFWEGASLEWSKQYALDKVKQFVVGGDGAAWIGRGTEEFGNAVFQLDGFHLSRACGRGYGADIGPAIYEAIRSGSHDCARALISAAAPAETATAIRDAEYVESNLVNGVDWRNRAHIVPADARSLGTMESNGDKLTANRMKKRGMSWTIRGANRMAGCGQHEQQRERRRSDPCTQGMSWDTVSSPLNRRPHGVRQHRVILLDALVQLPAPPGESVVSHARAAPNRLNAAPVSGSSEEKTAIMAPGPPSCSSMHRMADGGGSSRSRLAERTAASSSLRQRWVWRVALIAAAGSAGGSPIPST